MRKQIYQEPILLTCPKCGKEFQQDETRSILCPKCRRGLPGCFACGQVVAPEYGYLEARGGVVKGHLLCGSCWAKHQNGTLNIEERSGPGNDQKVMLPNGKVMLRNSTGELYEIKQYVARKREKAKAKPVAIKDKRLAKMVEPSLTKEEFEANLKKVCRRKVGPAMLSDREFEALSKYMNTKWGLKLSPKELKARIIAGRYNVLGQVIHEENITGP